MADNSSVDEEARGQSTPQEDGVITALRRLLPPELFTLLEERDGPATLAQKLPETFSPTDVITKDAKESSRAWELVGIYYLHRNRFFEAISVFSGLYYQLLAAQVEQDKWIQKGMPLVWIRDAYLHLRIPVLAKRYLMLTLCEDAIRSEGQIPPAKSGVYFRAVWEQGLAHSELDRYAKEVWDLHQAYPVETRFPEWILQELDQEWMREVPSARETTYYVTNSRYIRTLIEQLGDKTGKSLERLAAYLLSCMPGCRTYSRQRSRSTDYDVVCALEGTYSDFRSEFGRYIVCECKDWSRSANFTTMAKLCRVLDSVKARFGILFSSKGISGSGRTTQAEREQLKVFQDRGMVIVVIDEDDLNRLADGASIISVLREKYERVRLDLA